ncbi:glycosyl hydrolase [Novosphingobium sp. PASSN1]|uniref:glycosyl hydrolase n=1 Tax=Novosphingobium sp. PASSN1 TaxID=2015561 RepID=UPI000BC36AF0|nr:glycosyl hydrolase [Novosphingobium sp. PASSN1]OYU35394.1 MAG: glycoside hydrolase [Novosphingobium sp. PASSN1]
MHKAPIRLLGALLLAGSALAPLHAQQASDPLAEAFRDPPASARPRVWWHWMNGNVTEEGIRLDLEWMKRIGIGGVQTFDAQLQTPQVVEKRLVYMTPEWKHAFRTAAQAADKLDLELAIAASPGWSESGGPWVKPEDGMKKLVWSETRVTGGKRFKGKLAPPPSVTGPFQDLGMQPEIGVAQPKTDLPQLYRDTYVFAVPETAAPLAPVYTAASGPIEAGRLTDGRQATFIEVPADPAAPPGWVRADFAVPQVIRSATLATPPVSLFSAARFAPVLEASDDGTSFREVARFPTGTSAQYTITFPAVTAKALRVRFLPDPTGFGLPTQPAPGVEFPVFPGFMSGAAPHVTVSELSFSATARTHRVEEKAGFATTLDYGAIPTPDAPAVPEAAVIDLTSRMKPDGSLDWTPPKGSWRVLRMGYSLTGTENHPAPPEATGLEVDKFDADAVRRYVNTYLDTYIDAAGPDMIGTRGVRALLNDSIEVGASNWTPALVSEFKARRGYDPVPWLPALTGAILGSPARTDAFLHDYRQTLADLMADAHYKTIAEEAHKRGLIHYSEALEDKRPSLGDDMAMRRNADVPMAAMWSYDTANGQPQPSYQGDMRGAASVAHVYGQNLVAAESLTAALQPWAFAPRDLKPMIDMEFALGVNRPVIHTSVHQPLTDKAPGFSLFIFGQYFNRLETWADQAKPWVDYMARSSFMLQQGRNVADVAYFYGEEAPLTALFAKAVPGDLPTANAFDFVNPDVVLNQLSNDGADLVAKSGARYKALYLGGSSARMSLAVLKRIDALVRAGATLIGEKPTGSPALQDDAAEFARVADALWSGNTSAGRVLASHDPDIALMALGISPDMFYLKTAADSAVRFVHRKTTDADIYFITNSKNRVEATTLTFNVIGKAAEWWDATSGKASPIGYWSAFGHTEIMMTLQPWQSGFVVFRKDGPASMTIPAAVRTPVSTLSGPWTVTFQPRRGAPESAVLPQLADWSKSSDPGLRYFSGTATYRQTFKLPAKAGKHLVLDLGEVREVAEVLVNGKSAGILWKPPYRADLTGLTKPGTNTLEVRITNLWVNRLIGDAQPGAKPITFTTLKTYRADAPLRPSGLMGPVTLEEER